MPAYPLSLVELIDARVDQSQPRVTHFGTVTDRSSGTLDPDGPSWARVVLDGSSGTTVPVKCFGSVLVALGDRVGLVKFGSDWIIVGNYANRTLGDSNLRFPFASNAATPLTSATYVDMFGSPSLTVAKLRDDTNLRVSFQMSAWLLTTTGTSMQTGISLSSDLVAAFDTNVVRYNFNTLSDHRFFAGDVTITGTLPAGLYTGVGRWLRATGTGDLRVDNNDQISITIREVWP